MTLFPGISTQALQQPFTSLPQGKKHVLIHPVRLAKIAVWAKDHLGRWHAQHFPYLQSPFSIGVSLTHCFSLFDLELSIAAFLSVVEPVAECRVDSVPYQNEDIRKITAQ